MLPVLLFALVACQGDKAHELENIRILSEREEVRTLKSGRQIKVFGMDTQELSGETTLIITYGTRMDLGDVEGICREADELWHEFQEDVEKSGLTRVTLSQTTMNEKGERTGGLSGVTNQKRWGAVVNP